MKKIDFVCDKCYKTVGNQTIFRLDMVNEGFLTPVGQEEWCQECFDKLMVHRNSDDIADEKDINDFLEQNERK